MHGSRAVALVLVAFGVACGAPAPRIERAEEVAPRVAFASMDADVWAFERRVEGVADDACVDVELRRGPSEIEVEREGERFVATVPLGSGENVLVARCELAGGTSVESAPLRLLVRLEDRPRAVVRARVEGDRVIVDLESSTPAEGRSAPLVRASWSGVGLVTEGGAPIETVTDRAVVLQRPANDGEYVVQGEITDAMGRGDRAAARFVVEGGAARVSDPMREHARWIADAVIYGAVPFLFGAPGLPAITARIDAVRALGVDTIWLSPITRSPDDDYGYAVTDYFDVRESYGTTEDLRALVEAAHARGMRVLMDFVPNHASDRHPYFEHAQRFGPRSPYYEFFDRDEGGEVTHYFDWENLPNLEYAHPEVQRMMREAFAHWARDLDVDGFRIDAAWGVQQREPGFFRALSEELYRVDPQLLLIAEASARDPYWREVGFAAAYDWTDEVGHWAWREATGWSGTDPGIDVPALREAIVATERARDGLEVVRFLDNNDTGARFLTRQGRGAHDAASMLLFTLPGLPALFTGAEIGAEYEPYAHEEPLVWEGGEDVARVLARGIATRRAVRALTEGELVMLEVDPADAVLAFLRRDPEGDVAPALVAIELSGEARRARITLPADAQRTFGARAWRDRLQDEAVSVERRAGEVIVPLAAHGARVFEGSVDRR
ncbi:alpha-amylase family glycosyl hydrolase [Sandaracinus amylolyticus]|uniref:alpha-amylase family glycosyl hydrolase n=1 Tax=Sandaracinus amylolyticus TaxID=927083 RepID=UPI001EEAE351|nr:alpha-amylase family glycosyl hydrolase [Sandaracinus amylolyticus]